jgi:hypothetical protein
MTVSEIPPAPPPTRGPFQAYRRNIHELAKLEINRAKQVQIWMRTRDKVRELKQALSEARQLGSGQDEIVLLEQLLGEWEEMAADAEKMLQFINGERDRQVSEHRANISLGMSGFSLLLAVAGFVTAVCVAIFK